MGRNEAGRGIGRGSRLGLGAVLRCGGMCGGCGVWVREWGELMSRVMRIVVVVGRGGDVYGEAWRGECVYNGAERERDRERPEVASE